MTVDFSGYFGNFANSNINDFTDYLRNHLTSIGSSAFSECSGLTSITIPDKVTSIGGHAFYECSGLTSITIPDKITSIEDYTFSKCSSLTSFTIPNGVTSIKENIFSYCSSLTSIKIHDGVTSIGRFAFRSCSSLASITIPAKVTSIGQSAFDNCTELSAVRYLGENQPSCGTSIFFKTKVERVEVPPTYKDSKFAGYEIIKIINPTNYFTIGNLPPPFYVMKIGIFLFPLIIP